MSDPGGAVAHGVVAEDEGGAGVQLVALLASTRPDGEGGLDLPDVCRGCRHHPHRLLNYSFQVWQSEEVHCPALWLERVQLLPQNLLLLPVVRQEVEAEDDTV